MSDEREYPVPMPPPEESDPRFRFGLIHDVALVLEKHGYPRVHTARDLVDLQQALFRFIYGPSSGQ